MYRITFGIASKDFDVRKDNYVAALEKKARTYHFPGLKKDVVGGILYINIDNGIAAAGEQIRKAIEAADTASPED